VFVRVSDKEIKQYPSSPLQMFHYIIGRDPKIDPPRHGKSITYRISTPANCSSWVRLALRLLARIALLDLAVFFTWASDKKSGGRQFSIGNHCGSGHLAADMSLAN